MDRKIILLCALAIPLGLAGGYGWSAMTAPAAHAKHPRKGTISHMPASPEDYPAALDTEWTARSGGGTGAAARGSEAGGEGVHYSGCNEVRAAGRAPLYEGDPGYREDMDGDSDGIACEPIRGH